MNKSPDELEKEKQEAIKAEADRKAAEASKSKEAEVVGAKK